MKFTAIFLPFVLLAGRATAAQSQQPLAKQPPGCLLQAVNTQNEPGDMNSVCGNGAKQVQQAIASICKSNVVSQAQAAFIATCGGAGKSVAAYTATAGANASKTDANGRVVSATNAGSTSTPNAAPMVTHNAASGYVAVVMAVVVVAAC